jgi:hypothetical protein
MAGAAAAPPQLVMVHRKKSPAALFQIAASLPPAKGVAFAGYVISSGTHA